MRKLLLGCALAFYCSLMLAQTEPTVSIHREQLDYYNALGAKTPSQYDSLNGAVALPAKAAKTGCTLEKIVFGYQPYWGGTAYRRYQWDLLSDLCYFSYEVDTLTGNPLNTHNWATADVVDTALQLGKRVHLCVTLFDGHAYFLTHATAKQTLITNLINLLQTRGAHGINIDFEGVPSAQKANLTAFLIDLCNQVHAANPAYKVSIAAPAVNWSSTFDVAALNGYLDWFVIMGYDYYYSGSTTAGPVSGLYSRTCSTYDNLSRSLTYYLNAGATASKLVMALPYYGREWHTTSSTLGASTVAGTSASRTYKAIHDDATGYYDPPYQFWEPQCLTTYYIFNDGSAWHQCFADDEKSLAYRYDMVYLRNIAGIGIWALGYDDGYTALWDLIGEKLTNCRQVPCSDTLYDLGGPSCNHFDNENFTWTLSPENATSVSMTFSSFALESGFDSLWIYDGPSVASPLIGRYSGTAGPGTVNSTGGNMTLKFHSDGATTSAGWQAIWNCSVDNVIPVTAISADTWETGDFTAAFSDSDNLGTDKLFYQVLDYNGTEWRANGSYGFFNDNFTAALNPEWTADTGNWSINAGRLNQTNEVIDNTNLYAMVTQLSGNQMLYHWQMNIGGSGTNRRAGLHFFCDDASATNRGNSYFVYFRADDDKVQIYRCTDDVYSMKTNDVTTIDVNTWYDCKILYDPASGKVQVYLNDVAVSEWTDPAPLAAGNAISFRTGNCNVLFDDLKVYHSRNNTATVTVGAGKEVRYQNANPSTPACRIKSLITDVSGLWSVPAGRDVNIDWSAPEPSTWLYDGLAADIDTTYDVTTVQANWNAAVDPHSGIQTYWLAAGTTPGDSNVIAWTEVNNVLSTSLSGLSLSPENWYYVSVRAVNAAGLTSVPFHSDGFYLTLFTALGAETGISAWLAYPNPFADRVNVKFNLTKEATLTFILEDAKGSQLGVQKERFTAGAHQVSLELPAAVASQQCFLRIFSGKKEIAAGQLLHINNP